MLCYAVIAHTFFTYGMNILDLTRAEPLPRPGNLCEPTGRPDWFLSNLEYVAINDNNCATLGAGPGYFRNDRDAVTDRANLDSARRLAWLALAEGIT